MPELSQREHWDNVHVGEQEQISKAEKPASRIKALLGDKRLKWMAAYDDYLLWETIFPKYIGQLTSAKVIEIGSAPGEFLVRFANKFGCIPYGVEYSEVGVEVNKQVFTRNHFDPDNVIHADFFSEEFRYKYKESFDVVVSRGFIEHFTDVKSVIERHMNLLKPGGSLIISIPNLRGMNYVLTDLFDKDAIARHNINIMGKTPFTTLFNTEELQSRFCDYYGTFSFYLFTADQSRAKRLGLRFAHRVQPFLNGIFRMLLGNRGKESAYFSPSLLYIGTKNV